MTLITPMRSDDWCRRALLALLASLALSLLAARPAIGALSVRLQFHRVSGNVLMASDPVGRYLFIGGALSPVTGTLIDTQRNRSVSYVAPPGCTPQAIGGPWLALSCGQATATTVWLYNVSSRQSQPVPEADDSLRCGVGGCGSILAVGTDWLALEKESSDPEHNPPQVIVLTITKPYALLKTPASGAWELDLNAPSGTLGLCAPLQPPAFNTSYWTGSGYIMFDGQAAIAAGSGGAYLERWNPPLPDVHPVRACVLWMSSTPLSTGRQLELHRLADSGRTSRRDVPSQPAGLQHQTASGDRPQDGLRQR